MTITMEEFEKNPAKAKEVKEWAENLMNFVFTRTQENLIQNQSVDTGFLVRSGKPPFWNGNVISIEYDAPYALPVEYGQVAHPISHQHLIRWVNRKLRIFGKKGVGVAWAISKTIAIKGVLPRPYIRPAVNEMIIRYKLKGEPLEISDKPGQNPEF